MKKTHFIGIGGAGMAPLSALFAQAGYQVSGSDLQCTPLTEMLEKTYHIAIDYGAHDALHIQAHSPLDLVVYTSAANEQNPERICANELKIPHMRRGDALAFWAKRYKRLIAVSGSHGKTTITAMLAHLLNDVDSTAGYIIGGKVNNWGMPCRLGTNDIFATEADESDGSHTALHPFIGIVSNVEDDHAWSVGGEEQLMNNFKQFAFQSQHLIYVKSETSCSLFAQHPNTIALDFNLISDASSLSFVKEKIAHWADFQIANAVCAITALEQLGFDRKKLEESIVSFTGATRRMTTHFESENAILIEDYAHHPTEVRALLRAIKKLYPDWKIQAFFQPHRYQRLQRYLEDFATCFKEIDEVIITPVFAAWVQTESISHHDLAQKIGPHAISTENNDFETIAKKVNVLHTNSHLRGTLTLVIGAGDINQLIPYLLEQTNGSRGTLSGC